MAPELGSDQDSLGSGRNNFQQMCLESTEIDYLRQIVYSYMMGTDPVVSLEPSAPQNKDLSFSLNSDFLIFFSPFKTMAKVIVAVLKFPEYEKRKLIEN